MYVSCPVCFIDFAAAGNASAVVLRVCGHLLCSTCVDTVTHAALYDLALCPVCRDEFSPEQVQRLRPSFSDSAYDPAVFGNIIRSEVARLRGEIVTAVEETRKVVVANRLLKRKIAVQRKRLDTHLTVLGATQESTQMFQGGCVDIGNRIRQESRRSTLLRAQIEAAKVEDVMWLPTCSRNDVFSSTLCTISEVATCTWPGQRLLFGGCQGLEDAQFADHAEYVTLLDIQKVWVPSLANHTLAYIDIAFDIRNAAHHVNASLQRRGVIEASSANTEIEHIRYINAEEAAELVRSMKALAQHVIAVANDVSYAFEAVIKIHREAIHSLERVKLPVATFLPQLYPTYSWILAHLFDAVARSTVSPSIQLQDEARLALATAGNVNALLRTSLSSAQACADRESSHAHSMSAFDCYTLGLDLNLARSALEACTGSFTALLATLDTAVTSVSELQRATQGREMADASSGGLADKRSQLEELVAAGRGFLRESEEVEFVAEKIHMYGHIFASLA
ncbi:hypothetical protein FOMPIDRAFT_85681 [Fomitopsis schrenkii]|uniref:RING-type domain-containing protein n=1 Tax=Fomitopsis schrenkii TaxID=2126942 RepID=S8FNL3_FOMSC|nr:hypothetical protein FOMPIDRAFT_85681 [Fomitopsis schrenkii]